MPHNPFIFSPTQFVRIFVIVNITTYITTRAYLDSRAPLPPTPTPSAPQPRLDEEGKYIYNNNNNNISNTVTTNISSRTPTAPVLVPEMAPKGKGENTKKAAGNARKADAAAQKQAAADAVAASREEEKWAQGSKDTSKKQAAAAKAAEQAAKKAEREAMLAEEEKGMRDKPKGANKKTAEKKSRGTLDLSQLDSGEPSSKERALNASGIDNALDALSLTTGSQNDMKLDRHPERRFPAAYKAYEERRLPEIDKERPGLRRNQKIELIKKEFEKSDENPFNQAGNVRYDASKEELAEHKRKVREGVENRLGEK